MYQIREELHSDTPRESGLGVRPRCRRTRAHLQKPPGGRALCALCTRRGAHASLSAGHVSLGDILPVDYIPNSFQVVGPDVFILQVVSVLPYVDPQQRNKTYRKEERKVKTVHFSSRAASPQLHLHPLRPHSAFPTSSPVFRSLIQAGSVRKNVPIKRVCTLLWKKM